jgi:polysaccharide export outer membrane protein
MPMKSQIMRLLELSNLKLSLWLLPLLPLLALCLAGCGSPDYKSMMAGPDSGDTNGVAAARLHVGDIVSVDLTELPDVVPTHTEEIKDDGTITLENIGAVKAAGKTVGELQTLIHDKYVPAYYTHLTVTVKVGDRVFYVRGEVRSPGRQIYVGEITVTKAITSAGDFTDFAKKTNVQLTRANGQRFTIDCNKILIGEAPDPGVYPGDQIYVPQRHF